VNQPRAGRSRDEQPGFDQQHAQEGGSEDRERADPGPDREARQPRQRGERDSAVRPTRLARTRSTSGGSPEKRRSTREQEREAGERKQAARDRVHGSRAVASSARKAKEAAAGVERGLLADEGHCCRRARACRSSRSRASRQLDHLPRAGCRRRARGSWGRVGAHVPGLQRDRLA
jgi:hypothetical protein